MVTLLHRLKDAGRSGVYRAGRVEPIADSVRGSALDFSRIGLRGVSTKEALMSVLHGALGLPAGFGENWDALEDCLSDLSWRGAPGHVFVFEALDSLPHDDTSMLFDVLSSAAQFWRGQGTPFFAVFVDPGRKLALPDLLTEA